MNQGKISLGIIYQPPPGANTGGGGGQGTPAATGGGGEGNQDGLQGSVYVCICM